MAPCTALKRRSTATVVEQMSAEALAYGTLAKDIEMELLPDEEPDAAAETESEAQARVVLRDISNRDGGEVAALGLWPLSARWSGRTNSSAAHRTNIC